MGENKCFQIIHVKQLKELSIILKFSFSFKSHQFFLDMRVHSREIRNTAVSRNYTVMTAMSKFVLCTKGI